MSSGIFIIQEVGMRKTPIDGGRPMALGNEDEPGNEVSGLDG